MPMLHLTPQRSAATGFTLIELIMVLVIVGVLAAIAIPRFFESRGFDAAGFADQAQSMLQYAQKMAVAKRRNVCVTLTANSIALTLDTTGDGVCNATLPSPRGDAAYTAIAPSGITLLPNSLALVPPSNVITYFPSGGSDLTQKLDISVNGDTTPRHIFVEQKTGYVHS